MAETIRCSWCGEDPLDVAYHDEEWGVPVRDDRKLFEFLILEGAQAGLSWSTILKKRRGYIEAFDAFDPEEVARYGEERIAELLSNPGIVRNRLKVRSAVSNAQAFLKVQEERGSFSDYIWSFVDGLPIQNSWRSLSEIPATTPLAEIDLQRSEEARISIRRTDHRLRHDAGDRNGQRPRSGLFSLLRGRGDVSAEVISQQSTVVSPGSH